MSKSQLGQDLEVVKFYNGKKNGFFVDIGAADGVFLSNTYLLEKKYDWKGICVDPVPSNYEKLKASRPNSIISAFAVHDKSDLILNFDIDDENGTSVLSGLSSFIIDKFKNIKKTTMTVKTISLNDLLEKYNAPEFIDYLSIDTEGNEFEILKAVNFNKYKFGLLHVEHNYQEPRRSQIRNLLLQNNYEYIGENQWDDNYKLKV